MQSNDQHPVKLGYSVKQAIAESSLSRSSIYNAIRDGRLRVNRVGGRTIILGSSLRALIEGEAA